MDNKIGRYQDLEPFDFAVTFLIIPSPWSVSFISFPVCQIDILMYNIWKHCGAQDFYTLFSWFSSDRSTVCLSSYHIINCLVSLWRISRVSGTCIYDNFLFLSITSTNAFGTGFQISHNLNCFHFELDANGVGSVLNGLLLWVTIG